MLEPIVEQEEQLQQIDTHLEEEAASFIPLPSKLKCKYRKSCYNTDRAAIEAKSSKPKRSFFTTPKVHQPTSHHHLHHQKVAFSEMEWAWAFIRVLLQQISKVLL
jgi:hypothetical protein